MRCLEVVLNGALLWRVGIENALMYSLHLGLALDGESPADIYASGMCKLPDGRDAHVRWGDFYPMELGDRLAVTLVESEQPTLPAEITAVDDATLVEEQRLHEECDEAHTEPEQQAVPCWKDTQVHCMVNGQHRAIAAMSSSESHILSTLLWNQWHPDRCRVSVRSFGDLSIPETEWLKADLARNDCMEFLLQTI